MAHQSAPPEAKSIRTKPGPVIASGLLVIALFFGGIGGWAAFFPIAGAVIAPGVVKVSQEKKTVQHLEGGIVEDILVQEGDVVAKGDVLVKLQSSEVTSNVDLLQNRLWAKLATAARLKAQVEMAQQIDWPQELRQHRDKSAVQSAIEQNTSVFASGRTSLQDKLAMYQSQIQQLKERIDGAKEELEAEKSIIATLTEEITAKRSLLEENFIDKAQILNLERQLAQHRGRKGSLRQTIAESKGKIEEKRLAMAEIKSTYREKASQKLSQINEEIFSIREQIKPQLDAQKRLLVKAPVSGEIINLQVHSEDSGVIKPGQPILDIVPENARLVVECRVRQDKITQVKPGQDTRVQLSAFNRVTTPPVEGEVNYISADQVTKKTAQGETSMYLANVSINQESLEQAGAYLYPGMPAVCYITTEKRTFLEYLVEPILLNLDKAVRERF